MQFRNFYLVFICTDAIKTGFPPFPSFPSCSATVLQCYGSAVLCCCSAIVLQFYGAAVLWCYGAAALWCFSSMVLQCYGALSYCSDTECHSCCSFVMMQLYSATVLWYCRVMVVQWYSAAGCSGMLLQFCNAAVV